MDEEEFDSLMHSRPFAREDAIQAEAQAGRLTGLGIALWGRTSAGLQRQLLAPRPELPAGIELADLRSLQRWAQGILQGLGDPRRKWLLPMGRSAAIISVGSQRFTEWEARLEIVSRAINYLENH
jgi:hypothetical protein